MALGFPASHSVEIPIAGSRASIVDAAAGTFHSLGWVYTENEFGDYVVQMPMNPISWGETLTVAFSDRSVTVTSVCRWPLQLFDWGQNRRNVEQFTKIFSIRQARETKLDLKVPIYLDANGKTPVDRMIHDSEAWSEKMDDATKEL